MAHGLDSEPMLAGNGFGAVQGTTFAVERHRCYSFLSYGEIDCWHARLGCRENRGTTAPSYSTTRKCLYRPPLDRIFIF